MPLALVVVAAFAAQGAPANPANPAGPRLQRMVVTEMAVDEVVSPRAARIVVNNLVVELRKLQGFSVIGMDEVRSLLAAETNRQVMGCSEGSSCLSELADALGADVVIAGRIGTLDGSTAFSLRRIDAAGAVVVGEYEERLVKLGGGVELLAAIGPAVEKLFPDVALRPGEQRGVAPEQERVLNPPPVPPLATVGVMSFALGALVTGGAFALVSVRAVDETTSLLATGSGGQPISGTALATLEEDARGFAAAAVGAVVVGSAAAVGAGAMALFTDWTGLKDAEQ